MTLFYGREVQSKEDVNTFVRERIYEITGGIDNQLKWHREALFTLAVLANPKDATAEEQKKAQELAGKLRDMYMRVEQVVAEGKRCKRDNGYV